MKNSIKPFTWVDGENSYSVLVHAGSLLNELFDTREDEGFEGGGYDWGSLALVFLEEKMPELKEDIHFDPEADMLAIYSSNKEALEIFGLAFRQACDDEECIADLFSRAELD